MTTLLVTGASGYLGREVARRAADRGWRVVGTHLTRPPECESIQLDVRDRDAVEAAFDAVAPERVAHTAYRQDDRDVTVSGAANVAAAAARRRARLVHLSTDVVFGGRLGRPYRETDRPDPATDYGRDKVDAEHAVAELAPGAVIVRTSLMLAGDEPSQHERIALEAADGRAPYAFYTDEVRCPLAVADAAAAVVELTHLAVSGILHVVGPEAVSRYELACLVARAYGRSTDAIPSTSGAAADNRPADCRLDGSWARTLLATRVRGVRAVMAAVAERGS